MRQPGALGDPGGDADRPVGPGRDQSVDPERPGETLDRRLVLRRENAAPVGEAESGRRRIPVDDRQPDPARTCCLEQPELCRPGS